MLYIEQMPRGEGGPFYVIKSDSIQFMIANYDSSLLAQRGAEKFTWIRTQRF